MDGYWKVKAVVAIVAVVAFLVGALAGALAPIVGQGRAEKVTIAIQPTVTPERVKPSATRLERFLEERVGVDVEIVIPTTYAAVVEALRFGWADVAFMSAWPMLLATKLADSDVVLAEVREVTIDGERAEMPFYFSYWVVLKESPYSSLGDLRGKSVCFASPLSTSGYVAPVARLVELGMIPAPEAGKSADPNEFFSNVVFGGGYGPCWEALKKGNVDISIIAGDVPEQLYNEVLAKTRVIEKQGPLPSHGVVFSKRLKEPLRSKLIDALLELGKPEFRGLMRDLVSAIFIRFKLTTTQEHLSTLNRYLELVGFAYLEEIKG